MPEFCMIIAQKLSEYTNYDFFARKINKFPEFYMTFARKNFPIFFGGGPAHAPSPTPMSTEFYFLCNCFFAKHYGRNCWQLAWTRTYC